METYKDILQKYINNSGLSHREIARRCKLNGKSISQAYISQLARGDANPPSDDISKSLAEVTGGNVDELIMAGYIEKAPQEIKDLVSQTQEMEPFFKKIFTFLSNIVDRELIKAIALGGGATPEQVESIDKIDISRMYEVLTLPDKMEVVNILLEEALEKGVSIEDIISESNQKEIISTYHNMEQSEEQQIASQELEGVAYYGGADRYDFETKKRADMMVAEEISKYMDEMIFVFEGQTYKLTKGEADHLYEQLKMYRALKKTEN